MENSCNTCNVTCPEFVTVENDTVAKVTNFGDGLFHLVGTDLNALARSSSDTMKRTRHPMQMRIKYEVGNESDLVNMTTFVPYLIYQNDLDSAMCRAGLRLTLRTMTTLERNSVFVPFRAPTLSSRP